MTSARTPLLLLISVVVILASLGVHAKARRSERDHEQPAVLAISAVLPGADLAMAGGARHLRFPSLEEPSAAFSDGQALPDLDPAGGAIAPPIGVYVETARQNHVDIPGEARPHALRADGP
jgi:hypothetical protein